jgi:hypothetical protein
MPRTKASPTWVVVVAVRVPTFSGETAKLIDSEVRSIIDQCYGTAKQILTENRDKLDAMADALMKYETIDADQIDDIMAGRPPREPRDWEDGSGTSRQRRRWIKPSARKHLSAARLPITLRLEMTSVSVLDPVALRQPGS